MTIKSFAGIFLMFYGVATLSKSVLLLQKVVNGGNDVDLGTFVLAAMGGSLQIIISYLMM